MDQNTSTPQALPPAAIRLRQGRLALGEAARTTGPDATRAIAAYPAAASALMDAYFRERLEELGPGAGGAPFALLAVGGYGRGELCPASDVDVLLLYAEAIPKQAQELSRGLFHPLWDLGLDLGHGVRTVADCLRLAKEDTQVLTSLLDIRPLAGEAALAARLEREFSGGVLNSHTRAFGQWVLAHNAERRAQYGDSSGLLEPDLKNGLGGLRDAHQLRWLMRAAPEAAAPFTQADLAANEADYAFVLNARTALHLAAGRKTDRLTFDLQPRVARALGFTGPASAQPQDEGLAAALAVEGFLSRLHQAMTRIRAMRQACWLEAFPPANHSPAPELAARPGLADTPAGVALAPEAAPEPKLLLELFVAAARAARPLAWSALRAARQAAADAPVPGGPGGRAELAALPGILPALLEIFRASGASVDVDLAPEGPKPEAKGLAGALKRFFAPAQAPGEAPPPPSQPLPALSTALQALLDTGLLSALVPEFAPVEHLVQFDDFHIHPVGKHTLEVVRILAALRQGLGPAPELDPKLVERARALKNYDALLLAGFCHDLAKPDRDHSAAGARLAEALLSRLGAGKEAIALVCFLVREHLTIPKTATRRDLADESVAARLAETCATPERLDMLHLLAVADSSATGPRAWSPWTASLFAELAHKARKLLTDGPLSGSHAVDTSRKHREQALALLSAPAKASGPASGSSDPPVAPEFAAQCLERMPARALVALDAATIARHVRLARRFEAALAEDRIRKPGAKAGIGVVEVDAVAIPGGRAFQVSLAALDRPGLFGVMCGVLALHDLNILSAEVLTWTGGPTGSLAVDVFVVQEPADGLYLDDLWQRVRRAVSYALMGKLSLEYRLEEKRGSLLARSGPAPRSRRRVRVDNEESDFYTVVEMAAPDRLGLLHDLARCLAEHGLAIHLARIATSAGRIHDSFYVREETGQKLTDPARMDELKRALVAASK